MRDLCRAAAVAVLALAAAAPCAGARLDDSLPPAVTSLLREAGVPEEAFAGIALPQARWGRPWQIRAEQPMQPGSTMKLVTTIVALDRLGPNHRGYTELLSAAPIQGDVLQGDLVLKGGADPDLDLAALLQMLFELRQRGVREIAGALVLDRSLFRPTRIDRGEPAFDDAPEWPYNVIPDALMFNGNLVPLTLAADGQAVRAGFVPPLEGVELDTAALALTDRGCNAWGDDWRVPQTRETEPGRWVVALQGGFSRHCEARLWLQLLDRDVLAERLLRALWASLGGTWRASLGSVREGPVPEGARVLARRDSRAWGEVLRRMNKASDNPQTRLLFLQLGVPAMARAPDTPTLALAQREVERWFDENRIDRRGLVIDNGSGLSRSERIAPRTLARMIETALRGRHAPELLMSLPVAGVDGTMRRRLRSTAAEGWARLKTGTLRNVAALAGTVRDERGQTWVVAAMVNHEQAARARPALDAWIDWIARSGVQAAARAGTHSR